MSRWLYQRITPFFAARIRQNHRLLNSIPSTALDEAPSLDDIRMTDNCVKRMKELQASETSKEKPMLRLGVETGGCSGFQYVFDLDDKTNPDDRVFEREGVKLVIDNISYDFVKGATIDYVEELIRSAFVFLGKSLKCKKPWAKGNLQPLVRYLIFIFGSIVSTNPSAVGGCSCKSSFMVKQ